MATSAAGAVKGLISSAVTKADQCARLKRSEDDLTSRLGSAERNKIAKLDEYRQGLFCGGCGKTRSEILAVESTFPHPGQQIIRATPEQIAAKEAELDREINRLRTDLQKARTDRAAAEPGRDEALDQIGYGVELWRSAFGFERRLNDLNEEAAEATYRSERTSARAQAGRLMGELRTREDRAALQRRLSELESLVAIMRRLDERREAGRTRYRARATDADAYGRRERDGIVKAGTDAATAIEDFLSASSVRNSVNRLLNNGYLLHGGSPPVQGRPFRMGDADPAKRGVILPNVDRFLGQFNSTGHDITFGMPVEPDMNLAPVESVIDALKTEIAALTEAETSETT